jgi:hypothetical protein
MKGIIPLPARRKYNPLFTKTTIVYLFNLRVYLHSKSIYAAHNTIRDIIRQLIRSLCQSSAIVIICLTLHQTISYANGFNGSKVNTSTIEKLGLIIIITIVVVLTRAHGSKVMPYLEKVYMNVIIVGVASDRTSARVRMGTLDLIARQPCADINRLMVQLSGALIMVSVQPVILAFVQRYNQFFGLSIHQRLLALLDIQALIARLQYVFKDIMTQLAREA